MKNLFLVLSLVVCSLLFPRQTKNQLSNGAPFGRFESPANGATVSASVAVTGWALDDTSVESVNIYYESSGNLVPVGEATFVEGARPDVQRAYPNYPNASRAGWGYMMLTYFLPNQGNGTFTFHAIAADGDGNSVTLGTRTVTIDNATAVNPFGAIDTPAQGETVSGNAYVVSGWVLTPPPNSIASDGSQINVIVDGENLGHPTYNRDRPDVAALFPGYANSSGAGGIFYLDTTTYADGVHTIAWTAEDSAGNSAGIGSRYFTITNTAPTTQLSAVWANNGEDKVTRDELRASESASGVYNSIWDGETISVFGAKNEMVAFNIIMETETGANGVSVQFDTLSGPGNSTIGSIPVSGDDICDWTQRNIELFYIRYLQIKGLSRLTWEDYDERHVPERFRRPWTGSGTASGGWNDRPGHDKYYPDIAVPIELVDSFAIASNRSQGIWVDIYIPKDAAAGVYTGNILIKEGNTTTHTIPVELTVRNFTLPDVPNAKTMLYIEYEDINTRYVGAAWPDEEDDVELSKRVRDRHFLLAHRHKISLIGDIEDSSQDMPDNDWVSRLTGTLFTAANGYAGLGVNTPNDVYSIGTYGSWDWQGEGQTAMRTHTNNWVNWFEQNASGIEYFLYLIDESEDYGQIEQWAQWINNNPGSGRRMKSLATLPAPDALNNTPSLDIPTSWADIGITQTWENAVSNYTNSNSKKFYMYNSNRPACGTFATEDDGVSLRVTAWAQYKKEVERWFYWAGTYYNNYQGDMGETNVFVNAQTFGSKSGTDSVFGETGWNYTNGDGVLFYPGTDKIFPNQSYDVNFPFVSLRMKHWRRGIQDVDYLVMASQINAGRVLEIVNAMIPKVLWEYGVDDLNDPTYVLTDISWSIDPDDWEAARKELADIIEN
ncbi:MAG: DUF4091 domain-containing protein [bacterium]|nr:DUF4091 domain-containing protein [bacterium]